MQIELQCHRPLGLQQRSGAGGVVEACIVAVTLVFSLTVLRFAWTRRDALLAGYPT